MNCKFIKKDNKKCNAKAIKGEGFCFFHSEKHMDERKNAAIRGGQSLKKNHGSTEEIKLDTDEDLVNLLVSTINDIRQNNISPKAGSTICYIAMQVFPVAKELADSKRRTEHRKKHPEDYDFMGNRKLRFGREME